MKTRILLIFLSIVSIININYAQTNGCGSPTVLPVNAACATQTFTQNQNGLGNEEINASCATLGTAYSDAWYTVTGTGNPMTITISGSTTDYALAAFTSCAAGELDCDIQTAGTTGSITFATANGTTYYIQIQRRSGGTNTNMSGNICAVSAPSGGGGGTHNIGDGDLNACTGSLFDTGGSGGQYSNNELITETYCSDAGTCIEIAFTSFSTESFFDDLTIYDGPNVSGTLIGVYDGTTSPGTVTSQSGCLTFVWDSDGSTTAAGWEATISCVACPTPTCSDGFQNQGETGVDCGGPCPACPSASAQDCLGGTAICSDVTFDGNSSGLGSVTDLDGTNSGCLSTENQTSWYTFEAQTAGTLEFLITPQNGTDDYDFAMWGPYPSGSTSASICPPVGAPVRCSFAAGAPTAFGGTGLQIGAGDLTEGSGGDDIVDELTLAVGDVYILVIDNYTSSASPFTMNLTTSAGLGLNCVTLPIELIDFNGFAEEGYNELNWITASEINNDLFEIEKSYDGVLFSKIGTVNGNGNSHNQLTYNFIDNNPSTEISYYRLRQVDFDGKHKYSNVISVKQSPGAEAIVFPNPTRGKVNLNIVSKEAGNYTVIVSDIFKPIHKEALYTERGNHVIRLPYFETIPSGFYILKVIDENNEVIIQQKIIKK